MFCKAVYWASGSSTTACAAAIPSFNNCLTASPKFVWSTALADSITLLNKSLSIAE